MTKFRDFGSPTIGGDSEDVEFVLYGEKFKCRKGVPGKTMLDIVAGISSENDPGAAARSVDQFFKAVLSSDDEYSRFNAICVDPDKLIQVEQLMEIVQWLMETYSERPTKRPED